MKSAPSITGIRPYFLKTSTESFAISGVISLLKSLFPSFSMVDPQALIIPVKGICSRYQETKARLLPVQSHASCPLFTSARMASMALSGTPFFISQTVPSASKNTAFLLIFLSSDITCKIPLPHGSGFLYLSLRLFHKRNASPAAADRYRPYLWLPGCLKYFPK